MALSLSCSLSCLSISSTLSPSPRAADLERVPLLPLLLLLPLEGPNLLSLGLRDLLPPLLFSLLFTLGAALPLRTLPLPFPFPLTCGWKALHPGEGPDLQRSLEHGVGWANLQPLDLLGQRLPFHT